MPDVSAGRILKMKCRPKLHTSFFDRIWSSFFVLLAGYCRYSGTSIWKSDSTNKTQIRNKYESNSKQTRYVSENTKLCNWKICNGVTALNHIARYTKQQTISFNIYYFQSLVGWIYIWIGVVQKFSGGRAQACQICPQFSRCTWNSSPPPYQWPWGQAHPEEGTQHYKL